MNTTRHDIRAALAVASAALLLSACSYNLSREESAESARKRLDQLHADPLLAQQAPEATKEAELAVQAAEKSQRSREVALHLVAIADRKVDTAIALAQTGALEDQLKLRGDQRDSARLASRTREADLAHADALAARTDAVVARSEADSARYEADRARDQADDLQRQISELNAQATDRGLVVALGDVLFESGKASLRSGASNNLGKLAAFLVRYPDRSVTIEGHTDDVGSEDYNQDLSQRRADAVKAYLVGQGVLASRLASHGMGEGTPIAGNGTDAGRQQNRRVEVIIANPVTASR